MKIIIIALLLTLLIGCNNNPVDTTTTTTQTNLEWDTLCYNPSLVDSLVSTLSNVTHDTIKNTFIDSIKVDISNYDSLSISFKYLMFRDCDYVGADLFLSVPIPNFSLLHQFTGGNYIQKDYSYKNPFINDYSSSTNYLELFVQSTIGIFEPDTSNYQTCLDSGYVPIGIVSIRELLIKAK